MVKYEHHSLSPTPMMGYKYAGMMDGLGGMSTLGLLTWLVILVDLALVGVWLWKQIKK